MILSEVRERQISNDITFVESLKNKDTKELIYKTEIDSQTEDKPMVTKGEREEGKIRSLGSAYTDYYI